MDALQCDDAYDFSVRTFDEIFCRRVCKLIKFNSNSDVLSKIDMCLKSNKKFEVYFYHIFLLNLYGPFKFIIFFSVLRVSTLSLPYVRHFILSVIFEIINIHMYFRKFPCFLKQFFRLCICHYYTILFLRSMPVRGAVLRVQPSPRTISFDVKDVLKCEEPPRLGLRRFWKSKWKSGKQKKVLKNFLKLLSFAIQNGPVKNLQFFYQSRA